MCIRDSFTGQPEHVVNYFFFVAEEVRELMASMGIEKFDDLIGRADLLDMQAGIDHWKLQGLNFSKVFHQPEMPASVSRKHNDVQDHGLANALDNKLVKLAKPALERREQVVLDLPISNTNRTVGTMLSHQIAKRYGQAGLPDDTIQVKFTGTSGQSFAAFLAQGISFELTGEGNDYVGKGLCGGRIVIKPPAAFRGVSHENIIVGNTVMYGATTGESYFSGVDVYKRQVMSLTTFIGPKPNLLAIDETNPPVRLESSQPVLTLNELEQLKAIATLTQNQHKSLLLDITYPAAQGKAGMAAAVASVTRAAEQAVKDGFNILILSDRNVSEARLAIPALLACSATHKHLVQAGLRTSTGLVVDTGSAREVHHFALLGGYGAEAVCPWLAFETIKHLENKNTEDVYKRQTVRHVKPYSPRLLQKKTKHYWVGVMYPWITATSVSYTHLDVYKRQH